jgi:hypothetical protein
MERVFGAIAQRILSETGRKFWVKTIGLATISRMGEELNTLFQFLNLIP